MNTNYAKIRLSEWGRWSRMNVGGYAKQNLDGGRGTSEPTGEMPEHIRDVDRFVNSLENRIKLVMIVEYTQTGTTREKAFRLGLPKSTYLDRRDEGITHVHLLLDGSCVLPSTVLKEALM